MSSGPLFSLADMSVYVPETRMAVEEAIRLGRANGVDFASTGQDYADKGFRCVPVEEKLEMKEMVERVIVPTVTLAAERNLAIAAVLFASVTNEADVHRQAVLRVVREVGLTHVPVIQLGEYGCSTVHLAFRLAERFFAGRRRNGEAVLFVTADKAGKPSERVDRYMVFGDGACAVLCSSTPRPGEHATYGVEVRADGIVYDGSPEQVRHYFSTCYLGIRHVVLSLLRRFPIRWEQIRAVYCTNLGLQQWSAIAKAIGCTIEQIYGDTLQKDGHMHNIDVIHSVESSVRAGFLRPGDYYLTLTVGFGGYYGCALHRYVPGEA